MTDFKIKPELIEKFKIIMGNNCMDPYSFACVEGTIKVIGALDRNRTVKDACDEMLDMGLSGFMAGEIAGIVSRYHQRGDEFRKFWQEANKVIACYREQIGDEE